MSIAAICNAAVLSPFQWVQNAAARVVPYLGLRDITWHQRWSSYTLVGYLSNTELKYKLCTHQIQTGRTPQWPQHLAHVGSSRRPGLRSANTAVCRLHTSNVRRTGTKFGERCFSHAGPWSCLEFLTWQQAYYTDANRLFKKSFKNSSRVLKFVSAPGHFVSRAI